MKILAFLAIAGFILFWIYAGKLKQQPASPDKMKNAKIAAAGLILFIVMSTVLSIAMVFSHL